MAAIVAASYDHPVHKGLLTFAMALAVGSYFGVGAPKGIVHVPWAKAPPAASEVHVAPITTASQGFDPATLPDPDGLPHLNASAQKSRGWLLAEGPAPTPGDGQRFVTLTFDDGPSLESTTAVLDLLAQHHVHATFFFIGKYLDGTTKRASGARAAALAVKAGGHFIGSHTHDHSLLTILPRKKEAAQIDDGIASIERVLGTKPTLFRPPYGGLDATGEALMRERKLDLVMWSIEVGDMQNADEESMYEGLVEQIDYAGGGTVLLHDAKKSTVRVLARLLTWLDAHAWSPEHPEKVGYSVVDLPQFLRVTEAHPQPFADRKALEEARAAEWRKTHAVTKLPALLDETSL
ncbi:hypothetical protein BH09MYX1_BH09MYX1_43670 [soil metagenome]